MKLGVPWSVKGIRPEARETAREAARRSGMSLGDWLNSVILQQAAESGAHGRDDDEDDTYGEELVGVHERLDDLTRRIEQFTRTGPAAYAPKRGRDDSDQLAQLIARLDRRIDQFVSTARMMPQGGAMPHAAYAPQPAQPMAPPTMDRAVAEIAARQRALNGDAGPAPAAMARQPLAAPAMAAMPSPALVPVPTQDLSGLEDQLRRITDQIETLRKPGVEEAINALRGELGEIGRTLNDAMPRRAIDTIEKQIAGLTQRIAEGRQNGVDGHALAGVEHGLAEVRDALRNLTPAENLVGFHEAVHELAHKIDLIVAQKDPATLNQLEHAITTLRDMSQHVASNETVGVLAQQVQALGESVAHIAVGGPGSDALNSLEQRIDALSHALSERAQSGGSVPPRLEALVQSLSDKIEQLQNIQQSRGDSVAAGHLEDQIVALVQRLDASDSRLGHLEAIERGLGDLLVHIQEIQSGRQSGGLRADDPHVDALKQDLARTQNALEAVNGTLGHVVDRLAMIEKDIRGGRAAAPQLVPDDEPLELTEPVGRIVARAVEEPPRMPRAAPMQMPAPLAAPPPPPPPPQMVQPVQPTQPPRRMAPANLGPIDPNLPPDQPIEPGSGPPRLRAGARIASAEAALGNARPAAAEGGKSSFIAAARRAAKAAMQEASARLPRNTKAAPPPAPEPLPLPEPEPYIADEPQTHRFSLGGTLKKRMKSFFVAASIVALVIGLVQIMGNMFTTGPDAPKVMGPKVSTTVEESADEESSPAAPATTQASPRVVAPASSGTLMIPTMPPAITQAPPSAPSLLNPPALNLTQPPASKNDITGSVPKGATAPARQPTPTPTPMALPSDRLPIAIGSAKLRDAAAQGNASAAYEIATRFAEGRGVPVSFEEAARWYDRAAAKGLALAQFRYATLLEKGQGVKKDLAQARRLYLAAANQGSAKAMHNLAVLHAEGTEGRPDYATAAQWFRKAALRGVPDSQYNLGVLCARGLGTEKSLTESYKWFALAGAQGDKEAARKRDEVANMLEPNELAAAQQAVKTFSPEPQPHEATAVPLPSGGWDEGDAAPAAQSKGRTAKQPMSLGAFNVGKR